MFSSTRWHNLHPVQDELSPSAVGFVQKLQEIFHTIKSSITSFLHNTIFEKVGLSIDNILLTQVRHILPVFICQCVFSRSYIPTISMRVELVNSTTILHKSYVL